MSKYVVSIHRDRYTHPVLKIVVEAKVRHEVEGQAFITTQIMAAYEKRCRGKLSKYSSMRIKEYRVVDEAGLKRLLAAAKASVTLRRKRAAQKAAETRRKNAAARTPTLRERMLLESKSDYYPAH